MLDSFARNALLNPSAQSAKTPIGFARVTRTFPGAMVIIAAAGLGCRAIVRKHESGHKVRHEKAAVSDRKSSANDPGSIYVVGV